MSDTGENNEPKLASEPAHQATDHGASTSSTASPPEASDSARPPPILCLGMARTGTASLGAALNILGVERVHHGTTAYKEDWQWPILDRAADASFPVLPTYTGKPFSRAQWDELLSEYDAITDIGSFFALSLIAAYPDAKVILVERDLDRWHESCRIIFEPYTQRSTRAAVRILGPLARNMSGEVCYKFMRGWAGSKKPADMVKDARAAYVKHYADVRAAVPPEQLLDYKLTDGWEPLAAFLGKEPPSADVKFPHVNDAAQYARHREEAVHEIYSRIGNRFLPWRRLAAKPAAKPAA